MTDALWIALLRHVRRNQISFVSLFVFITTATVLLTAASVQADPIGGGSVQTWKDGSTGAVTITIDDNNKPDHAWWTATGSTYGIGFTWFVITDRIGTAFGGNWSDYIALQAEGHDIQSHTVDHFPNFPSGAPLPLATNYGQAIADIEANVPGSDVKTLAYPFGLRAPNDKTLAGQHYIGARGVTGVPNRLNGVDYLNVNSISTTNNGFQYPGSDVDAPWADASQLLTSGNQYYKGWISYHAHSLNATQKANVTGLLDYLTGEPDGFWIAPFTDVSQYAQERDTAQLATQVISADKIQFTLTDTLDDALFDQPLTVKVRVDNSWSQVVASQAGQSLPVTLIMDGGEQFALVNSVPDLGVVTLSLPGLVGDYNGDGTVSAADYTVWLDSLGNTGVGLAADGDGSGEVDAGDYTVWKTNFGSSSASSTAVSIPEPSTVALGGILLGLAIATQGRALMVRVIDTERMDIEQ